MDYAKHIQSKVTPQSAPIPGTNQVKNSAGGFTWELDCWGRLSRFLILGSEGGTYYAGERELTTANAKCIEECIASDPLRTVQTITKISDEGRAPKNDPAIFALAICCASSNQKARAAAHDAVTAVCRTGTHLFTFVQAIQAMGKWGRGLRSAVARYYTLKSPEALAYQMLKYKQRNGMSHRDVLRLCHAKPPTEAHNQLFKWALCKLSSEDAGIGELPPVVIAAENLLTAKVGTVVSTITGFKLPREAVPTQHLKEPSVWESLLPHMGLTAIIRNLNKITACGLTDSNYAAATKFIEDKLQDQEALVRQRVHPLQLLMALKTYSSGQGEKGSLTWRPTPRIVSALEAAFPLAFKAVQPTGKNYLLGLDVSRSMDGSRIAGSSLTAREAVAAMALVTARVEKNTELVAFCHNLSEIHLSQTATLLSFISAMQGLPFGGTDCALPILYAQQQKWPVEAFVIYTDNETWHGNIHPSQALKRYRQATGIDAKLIVVGMTATGFTIADPKDRGMLDVVGFDTACPALMSEFVAG